MTAALRQFNPKLAKALIDDRDEVTIHWYIHMHTAVHVKNLLVFAYVLCVIAWLMPWETCVFSLKPCKSRFPCIRCLSNIESCAMFVEPLLCSPEKACWCMASLWCSIWWSLSESSRAKLLASWGLAIWQACKGSGNSWKSSSNVRGNKCQYLGKYFYDSKHDGLAAHKGGQWRGILRAACLATSTFVCKTFWLDKDQYEKGQLQL